MKELFNKKFVYFMWEDELEGKKGFVADDTCELMNRVLCGDLYHTQVRKNMSVAFPFRDTNNNDWLFFYYDPHYEAKKAYIEGKQIQFKFHDDVIWCDISESDRKDIESEGLSWFDDECEYRIKPTEEYRPYKDTDEMIEDFIKRYDLDIPNHALPLIWVKIKGSENSYVVTGYDKSSIYLSEIKRSLCTLFHDFTYLDGSPIGMKQ